MFQSLEINTTINIIGSQSSGKTTYLAVLAYHAPRLRKKVPQLNIKPHNTQAQYLREVVEDIILADMDDDNKRKRMAPTDAKKPPKEFQFEIDLPSFIKGKSTSLFVKDYAGELFEEVGIKVKEGESLRDHLKDREKNFLDDLLSNQDGEISHWMIMLSDWQKEADETDERTKKTENKYRDSIFNLLEELKTWEAHGDNKGKSKRRIALVMTKCERGELWSGRLDPEEDIFELRFPKTYDILKQREYHPNRIKFFACSSYGVLGDKDPRPNRIIPDEYSSATRAYLRQDNPWEPYGLFSPIHWLITGRMLTDDSL